MTGYEVSSQRRSERFGAALVGSAVSILLGVAVVLILSAIGRPLLGGRSWAWWQLLAGAILVLPVNALLILSMWHVIDSRHPNGRAIHVMQRAVDCVGAVSLAAIGLAVFGAVSYLAVLLIGHLFRAQ